MKMKIEIKGLVPSAWFELNLFAIELQGNGLAEYCYGSSLDTIKINSSDLVITPCLDGIRLTAVGRDYINFYLDSSDFTELVIK